MFFFFKTTTLGMDQSKSNLPNTKLIAKSTSNLWKLRMHITGLLVHTQSAYGKLAYGFVDLLLWPHDCNLVMTLLVKTLFNFKKNRPLPQRLYIQVDNTAKENKNRFFLSFCAALVELKIFRKVNVNNFFLILLDMLYTCTICHSLTFYVVTSVVFSLFNCFLLGESELLGGRSYS